MKEQRQEMMILVQEQGGERMSHYNRDRDRACIRPTNKKDDELIMVTLNQESRSKDHQFQETPRTRRS